MRQIDLTREVEAVAEASYNQLEGEWRDWLEVAKRYEHKVPRQDKLDLRHDIILELYRARQRDKKPLPLLRAYRIASLTVALYWREQNKANTKVCLFNGYATKPKCSSCKHLPEDGKCAFLAVRPIQSLDDETVDSEGNRQRLIDTVATDNAIDLPHVWLDVTEWLLGCPTRLVEIAYKKLEHKPLDWKDYKYLERYRKKEQLKLF